MTHQNEGWSRRRSLRWLASLPLGAAMLAAATQPALAKAKKVAVRYQDEPKSDRNCLQCRHYIAAATAGAAGTCKLVDGEISPNGWCAVWAKARKPKRKFQTKS